MSLVDRAELAAYIAGTAAVRRLPLGASQKLAERGARTLFDRHGRGARRALVNLRIAYPEAGEEEIAEIGRRSFTHFAWNVIDFARAERWDAGELERRVEVQETGILERALARGRGALLLTLHMGNFELAARAFGARFPGFAVMGRPQSNASIQDRLIRSRARSGVEFIHRRGAARPSLRALRSGRPLAILLDQYVRDGHSILAPLFGRRCSTSSGMAVLSLRTGAPVIPAFIVRDGTDHHTLTLLSEIEPPAAGDRVDRIASATASYNQVLEGVIRKHPEQWMWAHRRFRHSPDLPPKLYDHS